MLPLPSRVFPWQLIGYVFLWMFGFLFEFATAKSELLVTDAYPNLHLWNCLLISLYHDAVFPTALSLADKQAAAILNVLRCNGTNLSTIGS